MEAMYSLRPRDVPELIKPILGFEGTKVMVAWSDRTSLAKVVKQSLCLADLLNSAQYSGINRIEKPASKTR